MQLRHFVLSIIVTAFGFSTSEASEPSQAIRPVEEYAKRIQAAQTIAPLTSDLFGEKINLYDGSTEFSVVDIDLPGDGPAVQLGRRFKIDNRRSGHVLSGFGSWDIDVPYMTSTFGPDGWGQGNTNVPRCSGLWVPKIYAYFDLNDYWSGIRMHLPGQGDFPVTPLLEANLRPTDGKHYGWYTREHHRFSCVPTTRNGYPGEGFVAVDKDGTRYTFDVGLERFAAPITRPHYVSGDILEMQLGRVQVYLLASRVEDRFGNWTQYHYTHMASGMRLTGISASDGRSISLSHDSLGNIVRAEANGRAWTYSYEGGLKFGWDSSLALKRVELPDATAWTYAYGENNAHGWIGTGLLTPIYPQDDGSPGDFRCLPSEPASEDFILTATHPGGTTGKFEFEYMRHERSGTWDNCTLDFTYRDHDYYSLKTPEFFDGFAIKRKTLSGAGIPASSWQYLNLGPAGVTGRSRQVPCTACAKTRQTVVVNPDGTRMRYTFGALFEANDGLLLSEEVLSATGYVLRTTTHKHFTADQSTSRFPALAAFLYAGDDQAKAQHRPVFETVIEQDGATFTRTMTDFDAIGRPFRVTRASSLCFSRTERTDFHDDWAFWTIGQVRRVVLEAPTTASLAETDFDARALPIKEYAFGKLQRSATYHPGGQLATLADGKGNTTRFNTWKRGIPQSIAYADSTTTSAVVDDDGRIASVKDQSGGTTRYTYDAIGRVVRIDYPNLDSVDWYDTTLSIRKTTNTEYGLSAGHWVQHVRTGNSATTRYLDSLWRPVIEIAYDAADYGGTATHVVKRFDIDGRLVFESNPKRAAVNAPGEVIGKRTAFDALGRVVRQEQDTELGLVATQHDFLTGFAHQVTDARGSTTTTRFMAFDTPAVDWPVEVAEPEDVHTRIARDIHGNPTEIRRHDSGGATSLSRFYTYDAHARLCKTVEPETGATILEYDDAGNVAWSVAGLPLSGAGVCNRSEAIASGQRALRTYDAMNRLVVLDFPDGNGSTQWQWGPSGRLKAVTAQNDGTAVTKTFTYNLRGLLTQETQTIAGEAATWSLGYQWNQVGNLAAMTYPSGKLVDFAPNAIGQPTRAGAFATLATHHPNGALAGFRYGNGLTRTVTTNARGLPDRIRDATPVNVAAFDESLDYDGNANVVAISDGTAGARRDRAMTYDLRNRLVAAASPMYGNVQYHYDVLDNLTGVRRQARNWDFVNDASNRLTNIVDATTGASIMGLGYDARGNLSNRIGRQQVFDYGNRLRRIAGIERYMYDGDGRRVFAADDDAAATGVRSMYDHAGVLRHQRDDRQAQSIDYIELSGSLVAHEASLIAPAPVVVSAPGYSTTGTFDVSWNATPRATRYELRERVELGGWETVHDGAGLMATRTSRANATWSYQARSCNAAGCGAWGPIVAVSVQRPPYPPGSIDVPSTGPAGAYVVRWAPPLPRDSGTTSYRLEERIGQGGAWTAVYDGEELEKVFEGRASGTYSYRVFACNPFGCSAPVDGANSVSVVLPPATPALTVPGPQLQSFYIVSWTNSGAVHYELDERFNNGAWTRVHAAAQTSVTITGRVTGTYGYRVRGCNAGGCGTYSATSDVPVTVPPPVAPVVTAPTSNHGGSFTISWNNVPTATRYEVSERVDGGASSLIQNNANISVARSNRSTGRWEYSVRACNAAGCGAWSMPKAVDVLTAPSSAPTIHGSIKEETVGGTLIRISCSVNWSAVPRATRYELQVPGGNLQYNGPDTSVGSQDARYCGPQHVIRACNDAGCSPWSNPPTPQLLIQIPVSEDGVPI